jgi:hypothetical protein
MTADHYRRVCQLLEDCGGVRFHDQLHPGAAVYSLRAYRMTPDCGSNEKPAPCHVYVWPPVDRHSGSVEVRTFGAPSRPDGGGHCDPWVEVKVYSLPIASFDLPALERAAASLAAVWRAWRGVYP